MKTQEIAHQGKCLLTLGVDLGRINKIQGIGNIRKKANFQNLFIDLQKKNWYTEQDREYAELFPVCF